MARATFTQPKLWPRLLSGHVSAAVDMLFVSWPWISRFIETSAAWLRSLQVRSSSWSMAMSVPSYDKASFYFAAHPDDWQLFMNPSAFEDVTVHATKAIFIHVTAGDAGLGIGTGGRTHPYYLARENGADSAIRFMADANGIPVAGSAGQMQFSAHSIARTSYRNTVAYFLRVPDGNPEGSGYSETGANP